MNKNYNNIDIPEELDFMVRKTIQTDKRKKQIMRSLSAVAATLFVFTGSLNVSSTFADTLKDVPIIGEIASILTFRSYETQTEEISGEVSVPEIRLEESNLDIYINNLIDEKVSLVLEEAQLNAEEYKEAYLSTGGTQEGYKKKNMNVTVDYEIYMQTADYLSFRVFSHESLAAVYASNLYFTVDLKAKQLVSLQDLIGDDYEAVMTEEVLDRITEDAKTNPNKYWDDYLSPDFTVRSDIDFYMKDEKLFIVFQKYELAAGAHGRLEFEIPFNE